MAFIDYYKVLGVERNATQDDIKKPIVRWPESIILT